MSPSLVQARLSVGGSLLTARPLAAPFGTRIQGAKGSGALATPFHPTGGHLEAGATRRPKPRGGADLGRGAEAVPHGGLGNPTGLEHDARVAERPRAGDQSE